MSAPNILPVTGDHFEDFLKLTDPEIREEAVPKAWSFLEQQIHAHTSGGSSIDLNRIYVDLASMQMLAYPIVEDWKRPLSNREWQEIEGQYVELEEQMRRMRKLSVDVRKQNPSSFSSVAPLFNQLFEQNQELRKNWNQFKQTWAIYKEQWKQFQEQHETNQKKTKDPNSNKENSDGDIASLAPKPPLMFQRERWHALRITSGLYEVELTLRCSKENPPHTSEHPCAQFIANQLRDIFIQTKGFELLEKVKLVQQRNTQLIQEMQPLFSEPIISSEMRHEAPSNNKDPSEEYENQEEKKTKGNHWSKGLLLGAGIIIAVIIAVFLLHNPMIKQNHEKMKTLKFRPSEATVTMRQPSQDPKFIDLNDMMNSLNLDIPVMQNDERLLQLIGENREKAELAANTLIEELGRKMTFAFVEANAYFLYWKGKLSRFSTTDEMNKVLRRLDQQKKEIDALLSQWSNQVPENVEIIPETINGEPVYGLEMVDEKGEPLQIYVNPDGIRMRLSNGEFLEKTYHPEEALDRIKN